MYLLEKELSDFKFIIGSFREDKKCGGYVSFEYKEVVCICKVLKENGIISDFCVFNIICLVFVFFYIFYIEVWEVV